MALTKKEYLLTPYLNEFMYDVLYGASKSDKDRVHPRYYRSINSEKLAKKLCTTSTVENKLYLLSMLGLEWFMILGDQKTANSDLGSVLKLLKSKKYNDARKEMIDKKLFVFSNKELLKMMGIMTDSEHHPSYSFGLQLSKAAYHIQRWRRDLDHSGESITDKIEDSKEVAKLLLSSAITMELCHENFGIRPAEMEILLMFYPNIYTYLPHDRFFNHFVGRKTKAFVTQAIRHLRDEKLIDQDPVSKSRRYTITGLGIDKINRFMKKAITI